MQEHRFCTLSYASLFYAAGTLHCLIHRHRLLCDSVYALSYAGTLQCLMHRSYVKRASAVI